MEDGNILTGKTSADLLAKTYAKESDITMTTTQMKEARREQKETSSRATPQDSMKNSITLPELENALKHLKNKKSPGPDGITNEMLKHTCCSIQAVGHFLPKLV